MGQGHEKGDSLKTHFFVPAHDSQTKQTQFNILNKRPANNCRNQPFPELFLNIHKILSLCAIYTIFFLTKNSSLE